MNIGCEVSLTISDEFIHKYANKIIEIIGCLITNAVRLGCKDYVLGWSTDPTTYHGRAKYNL